MKFPTSHQAPDYSSPMPPGMKKPKMKKVHPQITVKNIPPAVHQKMQAGKKFKAHVTMMPVSKGEGQMSPYDDADADPNSNWATMEMHSMEPEQEPDADDQPPMKTAGQALADFMAKKNK